VRFAHSCSTRSALTHTHVFRQHASRAGWQRCLGEGGAIRMPPSQLFTFHERCSSLPLAKIVFVDAKQLKFKVWGSLVVPITLNSNLEIDFRARCNLTALQACYYQLPVRKKQLCTYINLTLNSFVLNYGSVCEICTHDRQTQVAVPVLLKSPIRARAR